jgi:hypothetical protein
MVVTLVNKLESLRNVEMVLSDQTFVRGQQNTGDTCSDFSDKAESY